jgi:hypothetical protein
MPLLNGMTEVGSFVCDRRGTEYLPIFQREQNAYRLAEDTDIVPLGMLRLRKFPGETVHADSKGSEPLASASLRKLLQGINRGITIPLQSGFSTTAIQSTVQRDVRAVSGRRNAIRFVREAIDVGRCSKHIRVCGCRNQVSDLAYPMIECDMPLEIGRVCNSERAVPSIIKRPRDVVSLVHRHEKKTTWSCDCSYSGLGSSSEWSCVLSATVFPRSSSSMFLAT